MTSKNLPAIVRHLTHSHRAWIVGSAADPDRADTRDIDVIVPFSEWQEASSRVPKDAKPNSFGGWKFTTEEVEVDVWPGELAFILNAKMGSGYIWQPYSGLRWERHSVTLK